MATDDAIAGPRALAAGWPDRLPERAPPGVLPPGMAVRDEGVRDAHKPCDCLARVVDAAKTPGAPPAAALAAPATIVGTLDLLGLPALAVDSLGRVLDANRAAGPVLTERLRVANGRLVARNHRTSVALRDLIMQAAAARTTPPVVVPQSDRHPLLVYAFPITDHRPEAPEAGNVLVVVLDLGRSVTPPPLHLRQAFGLTEAQSRVAALLAGGMDLDAAAGALGIRRETVRGHLRAVFSRTGVRRQPELVALLTRLLPVTAGALPPISPPCS